ncbi:MAG: malectin domain-containing carbohydrate-binding protein [Microscillaceae bacterium]|nr:malectin domain-containing carbohydrate-binding protein [Microscillaceae bacterium]
MFYNFEPIASENRSGKNSRNTVLVGLKWIFPIFLGLLLSLEGFGKVMEPPVIAGALQFTSTSVNLTSVENGTVAPFTNTLKTSTGTASAITLSKPGNESWITLPANPASVNTTGSSLQFLIDPTGLMQGVYTATIQASAATYTNGSFTITLRVANPNASGTTELKIDFRDATSATPPSGWIYATNTLYGLRTEANQGNGAYTFGWVTTNGAAPPSGIRRTSCTAIPVEQQGFIYMHNPSASPQVYRSWEMAVPNGLYEVTVSAGDGTDTQTMIHNLNVEGTNAISQFSGTGSLPVCSPNRFKTGTVTVFVGDGKLTVDPYGGTSTRINYIRIKPATARLIFDPTSLQVNAAFGESAPPTSINIRPNFGNASQLTLSKSDNSDWLTLPGSYTFGDIPLTINIDSLVVGNYQAIITASSPGYEDEVIIVNLAVQPRSMAFDQASINVSTFYNQPLDPQLATITGNFTSPLPEITLSKTAGTPWLILPTNPEAGVPLSFSFDPTGLPPGLHQATVTASAEGYQNATLVFNLTVQPFGLNFSNNTLTFQVTQGQSVADQIRTLTADNGTPTVLLSKTAGTSWLNLPAAALGDLTFGVDAGGLEPGTYQTEVIASAPGYTSALLNVVMIVSPNTTGIIWGQSVNFQRHTVSPFTQPTGFISDNGLAYGTSGSPSNPARGWLNPTNNTALKNDRYTNTNITNALSDDEKLNRTWNYLNNPIDGFFKWEMAIANGTYNVLISVGDPAEATGIHRVNIEGVNAVEDFIPTDNVRQKLGMVTVTVADGRLTLDAGEGGNFTKLNYVRTALVTNPANDLIPPTVKLKFNNELQYISGKDSYNDQVLIEAEAQDAGGSGLADLEFSINGGPFQDYINGLLVNEIGNYTIQIKAVDGNNNTTLTPITPFKVVRPVRSNAKLGLYNQDRFPSNDNLTFSLIQNPFQNIGPNLAQSHRKVTLRLRNTGSANLRIDELVLSDSTLWRIETIGGSIYNPATILPLSIAPGQFVDAVVEFIANFPTGQYPTGDRRERIRTLHETLTIVSNDDEEPSKTVFLHGLWQRNGEGNNEPNLNEIIDALGLKTATGFSPYKPGNNAQGTFPTGDEVFSANWKQADPTRPIYIRQVAAFHSCCNGGANIFYNKPGVKKGFNLLYHIEFDGQSLLPRSNKNGTPTERSYYPSSTYMSADSLFNFTLVNDATDATLNLNGWVGVRCYKARDPKGNIIPNAYILTMDYLSTTLSNWDYNDNVYYVENIRPAQGTAYVSTLGANQEEILYTDTEVNSAQSVQITLSNLGKIYATGPADPSLTISKIELAGDDLEDFQFTTPSLRTLTATQTTTMQVSFAPKSFGAKKAELLIYYNAGNTALNTYSPLRIPLFGIAETNCVTMDFVKRIKSAAPNANPITIGPDVWESDVTYRKGSIKLDVFGPPIKNTGRDELYSTYLSASGDLKSIQYKIPLTPGNYTVRLHFAENYFDRVGSRVNNIFIENVLRLPGYDIFEDVQFKTAVTKDFDVTITDGLLDLNFVPTVNRPSIAGIEIFRFAENTQALELTLNNSIPANCSQSDGSITVSASGATNLLFKLGEFGVYQTDSTFGSLAAGEYTIYAKDADSNCEVSQVFTLAQASNSVNFTLDLTPVSCNSNSDGRARVNISGGTAPYTIIWNNNPELTTPTVVNLPTANNHTITVTDANGCTKTEVFSIGVEPGCPLRINAGGGLFISSLGRQFVPDQSFSGGSTSQTTTTVTSTQEPNLYATSRFGTNFKYNIPLANGTYAVVLHFAETSTTVTNTGGRIFNVDVEGVRRISEMDLVDQVGPFSAITETFNTTISDKTLNLVFTGAVNSAVVSGIEVIPIEVENVAPIAGTYSNKLVPLNAPYSFTFPVNTFSDPGDILIYTATQSNNSPLPSWISFDASTRTFNTFANVPDGTEVTVKLTAIDSYGLSASLNFKVTAGDVDVLSELQVRQNFRDLYPGQNRQMMSIELDAGTSTTLQATQFNFTTLGTSNLLALTNAKLYYTGNQDKFQPTNQFGTTQASPDGVYSFSGTQSLATGINYFWLVYDVATSALEGDVFGAEFISAEVNAVDYIANNTESTREYVALAGNNGNAYDFQGNNNYLELEGSVSWDSQITLEFWLNHRENPSTEKWIVGEVDGTRVVQQGNTLKFYVYAGGQLRGPATATIPDFSNPDVLWHHVVATYNGTTLQILIDGRPGTSVNYTGSNTYRGNAIRLGSTTSADQGDFLLDELKIWNRALSLSEIRLQMHLTMSGSENGLKHYFQFDEDEDASEVIDLIGDIYALRTNPTLTNWSEAIQPVGRGISQLLTVNAAGVYNFTNPGVMITFGSTHPQGDVVITKLYNVNPYERPSSIINEIIPSVNDGRPKSPDYWLINNYGVNAVFSPITLRFNIPDILYNYSTLPSEFWVHKRNSNSVGIWQEERTAITLGGNSGSRYVEFFGFNSFSQFVVSASGDAPLPISLLSFTAQKTGTSTNLLEWITASEQDNRGFEIEKSNDAQNFTSIGFVDGAGNSNELRSYQFTDTQAAESAYYRLKQIDNSGTFAYSKVIFVRGSDQTWALYPNPASSEVKILTDEANLTSQDVRLEVVDLQGTKILSIEGNVGDLEAELNRRLPSMPAGLYLCRFMTTEGIHTFKLVKSE